MGGRGEGVAGESGLWLPEDHDGEVVWVQKTGQNSLWCGPLGTLLCHSCAPRAREVKQCIPTPSKASDTTGPTPRQPELVSCPPSGSLTLKPPLWPQSGLWVSCTTAHRSRMGKTNALSAADRISWLNFLYFLKLTF